MRLLTWLCAWGARQRAWLEAYVAAERREAEIQRQRARFLARRLP